MNPQSFPPEPALPLKLVGVEGLATFDGHEITIRHQGVRNVRRRQCDFAAVQISSILHVEVAESPNGNTYLRVDVLSDRQDKRKADPERSPWTLQVEDRNAANEFARKVNDRINGTRHTLKDEPYRIPAWWQTPLMPVAVFLLAATITLTGFTVWNARQPAKTVETVRTVVKQCDTDQTYGSQVEGQPERQYYAPAQSNTTGQQDGQKEQADTNTANKENGAQNKDTGTQEKKTPQTSTQKDTDTKKDNTPNSTMQDTENGQRETQDENQQQATPAN